MSLLRRAVTGASLTSLLAAGLIAGGATPAAALTSDHCVHASSTRLLTANDGDYKLWVDTVENAAEGYREVAVCFGLLDYARGALVVRLPLVDGDPPSVVPVPAAPDCPTLFDLQDPVALALRFAEDFEGYPLGFCVGVGDTAYQVTLGTPPDSAVLDVSLYLDKRTLVADRFCALYVGHRNCYTPTDDAIRLNVV